MSVPALADLEQIYRAAIYRVLLGASWHSLQVNQIPPDALGDWLDRCGGGSWLTAHNPGSRKLSPLENVVRHQALWQVLGSLLPAAGREQVLVGYAADPAAIWPDEIGLLIPGLQPAVATELARQFGQAAFLYLAPQEPVQLLWT